METESAGSKNSNHRSVKKDPDRPRSSEIKRSEVSETRRNGHHGEYCLSSRNSLQIQRRTEGKAPSE